MYICPCFFLICNAGKTLSSHKSQEDIKRNLTVRRKLAAIYTRKSGSASPSARYVSHNRVTRWKGICKNRSLGLCFRNTASKKVFINNVELQKDKKKYLINIKGRKTDLAYQETIEPTKSKLKKLKPLLFHVR